MLSGLTVKVRFVLHEALILRTAKTPDRHSYVGGSRAPWLSAFLVALPQTIIVMCVVAGGLAFQFRTCRLNVDWPRGYWNFSINNEKCVGLVFLFSVTTSLMRTKILRGSFLILNKSFPRRLAEALRKV